MARTLKAGLQSVLAGGQVYWFCLMHANPSDEWAEDKIAFGNITTTSFTGTTVWSNRLMNISNIDNAFQGSPFSGSSHLAKQGEVSIELDNIDNSIDPNDYIGRKVEIRMGYGTTMSEATSDVFFTGQIMFGEGGDTTDIIWTLRSLGQLREKEIGQKQPETANEKYRGKITPISYGDWTDENAYLPLIVSSPQTDFPQLILDTQEWHSLVDMRVYDESNNEAYTVDSSSYSSADNNSSILFEAYTGATLSTELSWNDTVMNTTDNNLILYYESAGDELPAQSVLRIDDEYINVVIYISDVDYRLYPVGITIERGANGTKAAPHSAGSKIYQVSDNAASFKMSIKHLFKPKNFVGMSYYGAVLNNAIHKNGDTKDLLQDSGTLGIASEIINWLETTGGTTLDFAFEKTALSGRVLSHKIYAYCIADATCTSITPSDSEIVYMWSRVLVSKGGIHEPKITFYASISVQPSIGAVYETSDGNYIIITESNINNQVTGTIHKHVTKSIPSSGTLTKLIGTGDSVITYNSILEEEAKELAVAIVNTVGNDRETYNSAEGAVTPTDNPIDLEDISLEDISDLNTERYSLVYNKGSLGRSEVAAFENYFWGWCSGTIVQAYFEITFEVSPLKYDFYARGKCRENPDNYYTGTAGLLMENPAEIIEDFARQEIVLADADIDEDSFIDAETDRSDWKLALSIWSDMLPLEGI